MDKKTPIKKIALYLSGTLTGIFIGLSVQGHAGAPNASPNTLPMQDIRTFAEVYGQIKASYYKKTDDNQLVTNAIRGMVSRLDPHSDYLDKKELKNIELETTGQFEGLGVQISKRDNGILVISPIDGSPAQRAGIRAGDYIIKINGKSTAGMTIHEAISQMRGKAGTSVNITVMSLKSNLPRDLTITRAKIQNKSVNGVLLKKDYAYIRLSGFQTKTVNDLAKKIKELRQENQEPFKGIILDLRNNPGGIINSAVGVSSVFLPPKVTVVSTKGQLLDSTFTMHAESKDYVLPNEMKIDRQDPLINLPLELKKIPLIVLVNSGSASASEIVAGALQDYKRAVILGVQSFGKGSVQRIIPLSNGGALRLTVALYYTPNKHSIQAYGITPDVEVKPEYTTYEVREADTIGHIANPKGLKDVKGDIVKGVKDKILPDPKKMTDKEILEFATLYEHPNPDKDIQLKKALELVQNPKQWNKDLGRATYTKKDKKSDKTDN